MRARGWVLCLASAALLGAYFQLELPCSLLGAVALVPWLLALDDASSLRQAMLRTWLTVSVAVLLSFPWLVTAAEVYAHLPTWAGWPLLALLAPLLQPQFFVAALARSLLGGAPRAGRIAGACAWVVTEQFAPKLLHDTLGLGLTPLPGFRPIAALGTAALLTLLVLGANEAVAAAFASSRRRGWVATGSALVLVAGIGFFPRASHPGRGEAITVAAVQASLPRYDALLAERGSEGLVEAVLSSHEALTREASAAELIVWGETVYPTTFGHPKSAEGHAADERLSALAREVGRPLVFGGYDTDGQTEFNAAFVLDAQGRQAEVYRKSRLFPFGEFIPFGDALVRLGLIDGPTGWGRGPGPRALSVTLASGRTVRVQPLICYEASFPDFTDVDAELLVNLSNDGGFGSALEARQDLAISALRSIETGRPQLRVANSGTSALIDGDGAVVASLPPGARGVLVGTLRPEAGHRAWPGWWLAVLGLAGVFASRVPRQALRRA